MEGTHVLITSQVLSLLHFMYLSTLLSPFPSAHMHACTPPLPHIHTHIPQESLCHTFVERAITLLKQQNEVVATHPNSHVYSQLQSLVDFDGFYLESEPCLVCNDPEVPYSVSENLS